MKKYGKIAYIMLILIIFITGFCIYKVSAKNNSEDINEKTLAEIKYLENEFQNLFDKSKKLIDSARSNMGQMANAITVLTSFLLGRYIIEQEQQGSERAKYGAKVLDSLSSYLTEEYGRGFSRSNVAGMRQFYMAYKDREDEIIQSGIGQFEQAFGIVQSGIGQFETAYKKIPFKLSWTHYQILMRIEDKDERDFYEKEAIRSNWNVSTLKRQFHSSLYERLALSRDKFERKTFKLLIGGSTASNACSMQEGEMKKGNVQKNILLVCILLAVNILSGCSKGGGFRRV